MAAAILEAVCLLSRRQHCDMKDHEVAVLGQPCWPGVASPPTDGLDGRIHVQTTSEVLKENESLEMPLISESSPLILRFCSLGVLISK